MSLDALQMTARPARGLNTRAIVAGSPFYCMRLWRNSASRMWDGERSNQTRGLDFDNWLGRSRCDLSPQI
jgi:hypothetical protein